MCYKKVYIALIFMTVVLCSTCVKSSNICEMSLKLQPNILYIVLALLQGVFLPCFIFLSSSENEEIAIESKLSAVIMIADSISVTLLSLIFGCYHMKWLPYRKLHPNDAYFWSICIAVNIVILYAILIPRVMFGPAWYCFGDMKQSFCEIGMTNVMCAGQFFSKSLSSIIMVVIANFLWSLGFTAYYTLCTLHPVNDELEKFSTTHTVVMAALRIFSPTLGFLISSYFSYFELDTDHTTDFYYLLERIQWTTFFIVGIFIYIFTTILALLPRNLLLQFRTELDQTLELFETISTNAEFRINLKQDVLLMYRTGVMSDFSLQVESQNFPVHMNILAARSTVFCQMLQINMKENKDKVLIIVDMEADTVKQMLDYLYTDNVMILSVQSAIKLYYAADKYDLVGLKEITVKFMIQNITTSNLFEILELSYRHNDQDLKRHSEEFIFKHEKEIVFSDPFKSFVKNNPQIGVEIMNGIANCRYKLSEVSCKIKGKIQEASNKETVQPVSTTPTCASPVRQHAPLSQNLGLFRHSINEWRRGRAIPQGRFDK